MAIELGLCWLKWLKYEAGQSFMFQVIIPAPYTFCLVKLVLVKLDLKYGGTQ